MNEDEEYDMDDSDSEVEELVKKETNTPVTFESFNEWRVKFNAEQKAKKMKDPAYLRKKALESKQSGRQHFSEKAADFSSYFMDEKNEGDDDVMVRTIVNFFRMCK